MSTMQTACLITPQGKTIFLPSKVYKSVLQAIEKWRATQPTASVAQEELSTLIEETRGKYAGGHSLVDALLAEREKEREQEKERDQRKAEWFFGKQ